VVWSYLSAHGPTSLTVLAKGVGVLEIHSCKPSAGWPEKTKSTSPTRDAERSSL